MSQEVQEDQSKLKRSQSQESNISQARKLSSDIEELTLDGGVSSSKLQAKPNTTNDVIENTVNIKVYKDEEG